MGYNSATINADQRTACCIDRRIAMASITQYVVRHSPRQADIVSDLLKRIHSGELVPGDKIPSLVDLGKTYGASTHTVQRAIVNLRERGYLETKSHGSSVADYPPHLSHFGLVFPPHVNKKHYFAVLEKEATELSSTTSADGMKRRFSFFHDDGRTDEKMRPDSDVASAVAEHLVGGLIFITPTPYLHVIARNNPGIPCVSLIGDAVPGVPNIRSSWSLEYALDILKAKSRRRVALLINIFRGEESVEEFIRMAEEHGMTSSPRWIHGIHWENAHWGRTCMQLLLHGSDTPDALILSDDNFVPHATAGIAMSGVKVPEELTVVAHTNFPYPTRSEVPVIRAGTDVRLLMKTAVETIEAMRRGEPVPDENVLPPCVEEKYKF